MPYRLVLVALFTLSGTAYAGPPPRNAAEESQASADEFLKQGLEHYQAARYEEARESFRQGYELEPRSEFLFAMGQTERLSGDCSSALVFYARFVNSKPAKLHLDLANQMIEKCRVALRSSAVPEHEEARVSPRPTPLASPLTHGTDPQVDERAWHSEPIGLGLLGGGAVSVIAGTSFMILANSTASGTASSYQEHEAVQARAERQQTFALVGLGTGAALLGFATLYYLLRETPSRTKTVSISASEDQIAAAMRVSF